jgi:nucleotide-binding universal stress UspA family protein
MPGADQFLRAQDEASETLLRDALAKLPSELDAETRVVRGRSPAHALHDLAESESAGLLALGSSHRSRIGRVLAGSTAEQLLHGAPCPVAVAPRGYRKEVPDAPRVIDVGFNGLPESERALAHASALAEACHATLRVIAVEEPDAFFGYGDVPAYGGRSDLAKSERERLEGALADALEELPASIRAHGSVLTGRATQVIAAEAEKGADLVVLGSRGFGPLRRVLLGGVSAALMRTAPCPVLAVPRSTPNDHGSRPAAAGAASA